jgi:hypothetical protein
MSDRDSSLESIRSDSSITFSVVQVREFERIAGDHPDASDLGPPLAIGWGFSEHAAVSLDRRYECQRSRSSKYLQQLNAETRKTILQHGCSVSPGEIKETIRELNRVKKQRDQMNKRSKFDERVGAVLQSSMSRRAKRS